MTHSELIKRAERWLLKTKGCGFTISELVCYTDSGEIPDAIGWRHHESHLVECKVSRADFLSDKKKPFRRRQYLGMGDFRYYMTLPDIAYACEVPPKWGLLWVYPKKVMVQKHPELQTNGNPRVHTSFRERPLLVSALRRVYLRGDLDKIYSKI